MANATTPIALVTGANHGIGLATAAGLAEAGCDVVATYLRGTNRSPDLAPDSDYHAARDAGGEEVRAAIEAAGRRCLTIEVDLADSAAPEQLFAAAEAELGPVSILVHNASGWRRDSFGAAGEPVSSESADMQLHVDARAGGLLMQQFIDRHRARQATWGRIVTMTSAGTSGFPGQASYGATKAALTSYTLTAAAEMAADGVTANVVHPPLTDTGWITDDVRAFLETDHEHHHIVEPAEVAEVIVWLCTQASRVVTGNVLRLR